MFTADQARENVKAHDEEVKKILNEKVQKECEEIGIAIESVSKRGYKNHHYYKASNLIAEVEGIRAELEKNGYTVESTSATSLKITW